MSPLSRRQLLVGAGASGIGLVGFLAGELERRREVTRGEGVETVEWRTTLENENVEYVGDGTVRIVVARGGEGSPDGYATEPFDDWAERRCREEAARAVEYHLREQLGVYDRPHLVDIGTGQPIDPHLPSGILVDYVLKTDHGWVEETPTVEYERLVEIVPRSATAEIELDGQTHECTVPVWVQRVTKPAVYAE